MTDQVFEIDRKCLMITLAVISKHLNFSKRNMEDLGSIYNIKSDDGKIDYDVDLSNTEENSYDNLKAILEYCYDTSDYFRGDIKDDYDIIEFTYKYANSIILDINNEGLKLGEEQVKNNTEAVNVTPTQFNIMMSIVELDKLINLVVDKADDEYSMMLIARFIAESVQQASLFVNSYDLIDYMRVVYNFSQMMPCHEDDAWIKFVNDMLSKTEA